VVSSSRTHNRLIALALGPGLALLLLIPAQALGRHSAVASAPRCRFVSYESSADAPGPSGQQANQLDLVEVGLGLNRADTKLHLVMTIKNLSKRIPAPANYMAYQLQWTNPSGDKGPNAIDVSVDSSGKVTYSDGSVSGSLYTPSSTSAATGSFGSGPNGKIQVNVPLKELKLKVGQVLSSPITSSYAGVIAGGTSFARGSDSDPGRNYKLDQPTCVDPNG